MENQAPDPEDDLIDLLEWEPESDEKEPEAWLGHHEPDYSLKPDKVVPLDKAKYLCYNDALVRFAELAKLRKLKLHKHYETARHYVFETFYIKEDKED